MKTSATEILRAHCQERRRRRSVASASLDGQQHENAPRLSHEAWVESLLLVADVPEATLELLEVWVNDQAGTEQTTVLVEIQGREHEVRKEQVAVRLSLAEASVLVGRPMGFKAARELLREAVSRVDERLVRRAGRSET